MPVYELQCLDCGEPFAHAVRANEYDDWESGGDQGDAMGVAVECPNCGSSRVVLALDAFDMLGRSRTF